MNLAVSGNEVSAKRQGQASWQSWTLEKNEEGAIFPGDMVYLRSYTGRRVDIEGERILARWPHYDARQALIVEKFGPSPGLDAVEVGDRIFLRAHTGKFVSVVRQRVLANGGEDRSL